MRIIEVACCAAIVIPGPLTAQSVSRAVSLEPLSADGVDIVTVRNMYGRCGPSVVQVLGVRNKNEDFYSVDGNADIILIREGGRKELSLKRYMSDYNGVACISASGGKMLMVWSDCGGSACGNGYSFVVVDSETLEIVSGDKAECNSLCASRLTQSNLPLRIDGLKVEKSIK